MVGCQDVLIRANRAGLVSVARHLLALAQDEVPVDSHVHLPAGQEIESDIDVVIERAAD
ncbi:Imm32 family immunity protein [Nocardiopsis sinuspersici]